MCRTRSVLRPALSPTVSGVSASAWRYGIGQALNIKADHLVYDGWYHKDDNGKASYELCQGSPVDVGDPRGSVTCSRVPSAA